MKSGDAWRYDEFRGTVGASDLRGSFKADMSGKRPLVEAKLNSNLLDIADLGGFVGSKPGQPDRTRERGHNPYGEQHPGASGISAARGSG